jgi:peptidyl-dipeptidase A
MSLFHFVSGLFVVVLLGVVIRPAGSAEPSSDSRAKQFVDRYEKSVRPLEIEVSRLWWNANVSGRDEDYKAKEEAENRLDQILSDPRTFAELKAIHDARLSDPVLAREIHVLYLGYLAKQLDPELLKQMTAKSNAVEKTFSRFRARVGQQELTDNEVRKVLRKSTDSAQRRATWEASKVVGKLIEQDLKDLVKLRNTGARKLGFQDFHVMQMALNEQDQQQMLKLFDELDALTRAPFHAAKAEIDALLAKNCGISVDELRPWHYHDPFWQESPAVFGDHAAADAIYAKVDIPKVCREFYAGIGLPIDDVLARSDLYEKPGKNPHAFCTDIDREGDVRVLCNIVPNREWLSTLLHELGHATYSSKNVPRSVPYVLRGDAHTLCTEGVAMMFERFADNSQWLSAMGVAVPDPKRFDAAAAKLRRNKLLIFSRWCQVMLRFEKAMYANPDQDLNRLWWDLVEKYQEIKRPEGRNEPDFAAKIHIVVAPVYYHNYMMGELFASQVHHAIARQVLGGVAPARAVYVGNQAVGQFMCERVYKPGRTLDWNQLTRHATGDDLNPKSFAEDFQSQ